MTFAAGLLGGIADAKTQSDERKWRDREFSLMEATLQDRREDRAFRRAGGYGVTDVAGGGTGPVAAYDGKITERPAFAFDYFRKQGIPDHVAAGLVGNLMQESGADINPAAVGDNGNAFGAGQWNGPRMRAYKAFAAERGVEPTDFQTQLDFLLHEGKTSEAGAWGKIMGAKTAEDAALIASQAFWRPGVPHNDRRMSYAASIFANRPANEAAAPARGSSPEAAAAEPQKWRWFENLRASNGAN